MPGAKADKQPDTRPMCHERLTGYASRRVPCTNKGVWCWVVGEFGRSARVLCADCIKRLRAEGWTVRYQLEGDNPPPAPTVGLG